MIWFNGMARHWYFSLRLLACFVSKLNISQWSQNRKKNIFRVFGDFDIPEKSIMQTKLKFIYFERFHLFNTFKMKIYHIWQFFWHFSLLRYMKIDIKYRRYRKMGVHILQNLSKNCKKLPLLFLKIKK